MDSPDFVQVVYEDISFQKEKWKSFKGLSHSLDKWYRKRL